MSYRLSERVRRLRERCGGLRCLRCGGALPPAAPPDDRDILDPVAARLATELAARLGASGERAVAPETERR